MEARKQFLKTLAKSQAGRPASEALDSERRPDHDTIAAMVAEAKRMAELD